MGMRTLALLAILTVSALALAGCSGDGDGDGDPTSSSSSSSRSSSSTSTSRSSSSSTSASSTSTGPANQAPSGSISVSVNGTNATFTLTGSDPDGDIVVWDLAFGDGNATNGTSLPANVTHAYAGAGNFTANFTMTDGTDPVTYDVVVELAGAGAGPGPQTFHGEWAASWTFACEVIGVYPAADVTHSILAVDAATIGKAYTATFTSTTPNPLGYGMSFQDGAGAENSFVQGPSPLTGTVPTGTVEIWFYACGGGAHSVDYSAG